ncbi:MAG: alpha/beta hydrolase [Candidatus Heimdallarchaeota archaeon]|nr:MAG: alpha/beta hydrolase [Candidatus Heimdallarchaeota archaeon]
MSEEIRAEWLATYHEGDSRIREKRHGLLRLNSTKQRIEFAVQTAESSPIIIVNYPLNHLQTVKLIEKRQKMKKQNYLQLELGEGPNVMTPLFSFSISDLEAVKNEILTFQEEYKVVQAKEAEDTEVDVVKAFAKLLMTPVEQFQQILGDVTSRLRILTTKPKEVTKTVLSPLEPQFPYQTQMIELSGRKVSFYSTSYSHDTILILLSPVGGEIENYYPMISSLLGKYQLYILGTRGFTEPIDQDVEFKLKDYVQDLKDFIEYLGTEKEIVLGAHSLFSAIILEEFLKPKYSNINQFILVSGAHRAPDNFRNGVKVLPPTPIWGSFKGQVKKLAPKILFSRSTKKEIVNPFIQSAFNVPDKVYYEIFKDFIPRDYTKKLQSSTKPILVVWGKNDKLIPKDLREELIECVSSDLLTFREIPGSHMVIFEEPNLVAREINRFIAKKWSQIEIE